MKHFELHHRDFAVDDLHVHAFEDGRFSFNNRVASMHTARYLHAWLGEHIAAHEAPTAPAPAPVARRVPGCGEWKNFDDCAYLYYLAPDRDDLAADAHDDGDWLVYRPEPDGATIANGTARGETPAECLANAKRAAEDALIAEAARVAAESQPGQAAQPRHSADDVPVQTAWEVAVSLYPSARLVVGSPGEAFIRRLADQVFDPAKPGDAALREWFRARVDHAVLGATPAGICLWGDPPAGTHDALPEPTTDKVTP